MRHNAWRIDHEEKIIYNGGSADLGIAKIDKHKNITITHWKDSSRNKTVKDRIFVTELRNGSYFIRESFRSGILIMPEICPYFNWGLVMPYAWTSLYGPVNKLIYKYVEEHYLTGEWAPNL